MCSCDEQRGLCPSCQDTNDDDRYLEWEISELVPVYANEGDEE